MKGPILPHGRYGISILERSALAVTDTTLADLPHNQKRYLVESSTFQLSLSSKESTSAFSLALSC